MAYSVPAPQLPLRFFASSVYFVALPVVGVPAVAAVAAVAVVVASRLVVAVVAAAISIATMIRPLELFRSASH